ncbi:MAG TPA: hypothetical protein VL242_03030 [Sorangium sp.]|nr:hypothetical protein [Sorangium sp.]
MRRRRSVTAQRALALEASGGTAGVQLWRFVRFDVETVRGFPLEIMEIRRSSERDPAASATYRAERRAQTEAMPCAAVFRPVGSQEDGS